MVPLRASQRNTKHSRTIATELHGGSKKTSNRQSKHFLGVETRTSHYTVDTMKLNNEGGPAEQGAKTSLQSHDGGVEAPLADATFRGRRSGEASVQGHTTRAG